MAKMFLGLVLLCATFGQQAVFGWQSVPGKLIVIAADDGKIVGVNRRHQIYFRTGVTAYNPKGSDWVGIPGGLKHIAVGDGKIGGVNSADHIFFRTGITACVPQGTGWVKIPGGLKQLSIGDGKIMGVNSADMIYYRTGISSSKPFGTSWVRLGGGLKYISVGDGKIVGVNSADHIYVRTGINAASPYGTGWKKLNGALKMIEVGNGRMFGVNSADNIYERVGVTAANPAGGQWKHIGGKLKHLTLGNGKLMGTNSGDNIFYLAQKVNQAGLAGPSNGIAPVVGWQSVPGKLIVIAADDGKILGVNSGHQIYFRTGVTAYSPKGCGWVRIAGGLKHIAVGDGKIGGVNRFDRIYFRTGITASVPQGTGWVKIDGGLKQLSIGDGKIMGVNSADMIYYRTGISSSKPFGTSWVRLGGGLKYISVGDGKIVGVNSADHIYVRTGINAASPYGTGWKKLDGALKMIEVGNGRMFGVNSADNIYERVGVTAANPAGGQWKHIGGKLKHLTLGNGKLMGTNSGDNIFYLAQKVNQAGLAGPGNGIAPVVGWQLVPGKLIVIAADDGKILGVNKHHQIFFRTGVTACNPKGSGWERIPGGLKHIAVGDGKIGGVNRLDHIYFRTEITASVPQGTGWVKIPGGLKQLSIGDGKIMGVNSADMIFYRIGISSSKPFGTSWVRLDGGLKYISVGDGKIVGVNRVDHIYVRTGINAASPYGTGWKKLDGALKMIEVGNGRMFGVNSGDNIYERVGVTAANPAGGQWKHIGGKLKHVTLGNGNMMGTNSGDNIYYMAQKGNRCAFGENSRPQPAFYSMLAHPSAKLMGSGMTFPKPKAVGVGRFDFDGRTATWTNLHGKRGPWQWIGWASRSFANKDIEVKFSINFIGKVPDARKFNNLGVKVYGVIIKDWISKCAANKWCDVTVKTKCRAAGDGNHVILIFDDLNYKQKIQIRDFRVEFPEVVLADYKKPTVYMNKPFAAQGVVNGKGRMNFAGDLVTYSKTATGASPWQWLGWRGNQFANKVVRVSFWIKFHGKVPKASGNFGMKIYGVVHNKWVRKCVANQWCYVEKTVTNRAAGDAFHIILIFDSMTERNTIQVENLNLQVIKPKEIWAAYATKPLYVGKGRGLSGANKMSISNGVIGFNKGVVGIRSWMWFGWQDAAFSNKWVRLSAFVTFRGQVPPPSYNYGLKVYGEVYNKFAQGCRPNKECYVEQLLKVNRAGDANHILMIFDSVINKQYVAIRNFNMEVF